MPATVAEMTPSELREMIRTVVVETFDQILVDLNNESADDDDGEIRPEVRKQLLLQLERTKRGELGVPMQNVLSDLGISA